MNIENQQFRSESQCVDKGHGRRTTWITRTYDIDTFAPYDTFKKKVIPQWAGLKTIVVVRRIVTHTNLNSRKKDSDKVSFWISNKKLLAKEFFEGIRGHWKIETMHRDRDLFFNEDCNRIKDFNRAAIFAVFNCFAINFLHTFYNLGTSISQILFGHHFKELVF